MNWVGDVRETKASIVCRISDEDAAICAKGLGLR